MRSPESALAELVAFPTVSSRPLTAMAAWLAEGAARQGFRVERFETGEPGKCNVVCSAGPQGTDGLVLSGHMDVVPVENQPWTSDPFTLTRRGDDLVGRGSCDMKAFLAAAMVGLGELDLSKLTRELVLVWTCDEEIGCLGSRALVAQLQQSGRPMPSLCWIGEPTNLQMLRMHAGHVAVRLTLRGRAAHSSKPDLGESAILKAGPVLAALEALAARWRARVSFADVLERPYVVMNVATIHGGSAINIVPDQCVIDLGFRPLPGMNAEELVAEVQAAVAPYAEAALMRVTPAMLTREGCPLEGLLRPHACSDVLGAAPFATDGGNLSQLGMETLIFGPGSIDVAHQADEFVPIGELYRVRDAIQRVVWQRCVG